MNQLEALERRRRNLRIVFFSIILGTLPLYCLGFLLWGTAPARALRTPTPGLPTSFLTLEVTATNSGQLPTLTPFPTFAPATLIPFTQPVIVTRFLSPTVLIPTQPFFTPPIPTLAPTLTPFPTLTPVPPTNTPVPTETPIPISTDTPIPISTDTPTPTPTATDTEIPPVQS